MAGTIDLVVISLAAAAERRRSVAERLEGFPTAWALFDARTEAPAGLPYREAQALVHRGRTLRRGELGAFGSHHACLREFVERGTTGYRIIAEDDVILDPGFPYASLPELMSACDIDYLRLHATFMRPSAFVAHLGRYRQLIRFRAPTLGACAYVVSKAGAKRFLGSVREIVRPFDDELDRYWHNGLPLYAIHPGPALELYGATTIAKPAEPVRLPGFAGRMRHRLSRLAEGLRRQASDAGLRARDRRVARSARSIAARLFT